MLFRSLRSLARRVMVAGAAGAVALTAFNVAQPSLGVRRIDPGKVEDVQLALAPASAPAGRMPGVTSTIADPTIGRRIVASSAEQTMPSSPMSRACAARSATSSGTVKS